MSEDEQGKHFKDLAAKILTFVQDFPGLEEKHLARLEISSEDRTWLEDQLQLVAFLYPGELEAPQLSRDPEMSDGQRIFICLNCAVTFKQEANGDGCCRYHTDTKYRPHRSTLTCFLSNRRHYLRCEPHERDGTQPTITWGWHKQLDGGVQMQVTVADGGNPVKYRGEYVIPPEQIVWTTPFGSDTALQNYTGPPDFEMVVKKIVEQPPPPSKVRWIEEY
ncbi:hypothetical protein F5Y15DRAFT_422352 [Xylariaceae sp. FL0016]|nr:hypothetical protein F5Y15DRAFT_422352 [Xylariaceae sp. FL0016]